MKNIYLNSSSRKFIDALTKKLPQSLMLSGDPGVGLGAIAGFIADAHDVRTTVILPEKDEKIDIEKGIIGVDLIRRLYDMLKTKSSKRIIVIDYAERMTHQSQNAFLKLLEEPNSGTHFILLAHSTTGILPTIMSRVEEIKIKPISKSQTEKLLDSMGITDEKKRAQLLYIASGLPAEIIRLAGDTTYFEKRSQIIRDAKEMLASNKYAKFQIAQKYKDDRPSALQLLGDMAKMLKANLTSHPSDTINKLDDILDAYQMIESNCNIRLTLARIIA
ncbi:hypothetical protein HGB24_03070 [Candidatus Saccharibacteria bacterium]|nr:hypothetical protein [Candidatus Saccharibacteria bacterium]